MRDSTGTSSRILASMEAPIDHYAGRITIPQIQRHHWFLRDLPPGVAEMNDRLVPPGAPSIKSFCMPEGVQVSTPHLSNLHSPPA